jgi:hypothetical protein
MLMQHGGVGDDPRGHPEFATGHGQVGVLTGVTAEPLVEASHPIERRSAHGHAQPPQQFVSRVESNPGERSPLTSWMGPPLQFEFVHVVVGDHDRWQVQDVSTHDRVVRVEGIVDARDEARGRDRVGITECQMLADRAGCTEVARPAVGNRTTIVEVESMNGRSEIGEQVDDARRILLPTRLDDDHLESSVGLAFEPAQQPVQHLVPVAHERDDAQHLRRPGSPMTTSVRNVVICGAPRSGTSMLAEIFMRAGYHPGRDFIPPSPSNPHGFFEDIRVNRMNDDLLAELTPGHHDGPLPRSLWWMESFDGPVGARDVARCRELVPPAPFVMKDPRFVYTGPAWTAAWTAASSAPLVIVMVRPIDDVTRSLASMAARQPEHFAAVASLRADFTARVRSMWDAMYRSVLSWVDDDAVFVSERDVRTGAALTGLGHLVGSPLRGSTIDPTLHHHGEGDRPQPTVDMRDITDVAERVARRVRRDGVRLGAERNP